MRLFLALEVEAVGAFELARIEIRGGQEEHGPLARLHLEAFEHNVLRHFARRHGEGIAPQQLLGRLGNDLRVGAQLPLQVEIAGEVADAETHPVHDGVEAGDEEHHSVVLHVLQGRRAAVDLRSPEQADQIVLRLLPPLEHGRAQHCRDAQELLHGADGVRLGVRQVVLDQRPVLRHSLQRQSQHLEKDTNGQRLGDVGHEIAAAAVLDGVDELVRERADVFLERQHGGRRERLLQRRAILGVIGRVEVDRRRLRDARGARRHHRLDGAQLLLRGEPTGEGLDVARRLEVGRMAHDHPVAAVARSPEYRGRMSQQVEDPFVRVGPVGRIAEHIEVVDGQVRNMGRLGDGGTQGGGGTHGFLSPGASAASARRGTFTTSSRGRILDRNTKQA